MLNTILAIAGKPGLYKFVSRGNKMMVVEAIDQTKKRLPALATDKIVALSDISIYTDDDKEIPLADVFENIKKIFDSQIVDLHHKKASQDEIIEFFQKVLPNYDNDRVQITKRCEYAADGSVVLKASEVVETTTFPTEAELYLSTGNYTITLPGYSNAYLMVRCMASNIYTAQFLTKSELSQTASQIRTEVSATYATKNELATTNSTITQTADSIRSEVAQTYQTKSAAEDDYDSLSSSITQTATEINTEVAQKVGKTEVISSINQSAEEIQIEASKISLRRKRNKLNW